LIKINFTKSRLLTIAGFLVTGVVSLVLLAMQKLLQLYIFFIVVQFLVLIGFILGAWLITKELQGEASSVNSSESEFIEILRRIRWTTILASLGSVITITCLIFMLADFYDSGRDSRLNEAPLWAFGISGLFLGIALVGTALTCFGSYHHKKNHSKSTNVTSSPPMQRLDGKSGYQLSVAPGSEMPASTHQ
jgi:hypothetical protein